MFKQERLQPRSTFFTPHHDQSTFSDAMNTTKLKLISPAIAAWVTFTAAVLCTSMDAIAQTDLAKKEKTTLQDWGFGELSKELMPLFEGLNKSRGSWSFKGEATHGQTAKPLQGKLSIQGNPKAGMVAMWNMEWSWPADNPEQVIACIVMAGPGKNGLNLSLIRFGPVDPKIKKNDPKIRRAMFEGAWDSKSRTITWTESDLPGQLSGQPKEKDAEKQKQTFEMVVAVDGKITLQNSKHMLEGQLVSGKADKRTGQAPAKPATLTGEHRFKTAAEVLDRRIKPWIPPQATEVSLLSERNGHYARYKVKEDHFIKFLDGLWAADMGKSAHKREDMKEGSPGNPESIAKRLKTVGKEPLGNFKVYYSPSKQSSAMTTYFYDRETGIVYHDRGYW